MSVRSSLTIAALIGTLFAVGCSQGAAPTVPTSPSSDALASGISHRTGSAAALTVVGPEAGVAKATMTLTANVIAVSYKAPNPFLDVTVAIPKSIDNAARNGKADVGLQVIVTYASSAGTVETVDSGRVSIKNGTKFVSIIDNRTVAIALQVQLGAFSPPGPNPAFSATARLFLPAGRKGDDNDDNEDKDDR